MACELARGDYLWIAEADDRCKPDFLARLMREMDEGVAFAFSDSAQIDESGAAARRQLPGLLPAVRQRHDASATSCSTAIEFVRRCLVERNLVLNVSAVVWNLSCLRETLDRCLDELLDYQLAGDWHLYAATALGGKRVAYVSDPLNIHRRHANGVTGLARQGAPPRGGAPCPCRLSDWLPADEDDRARMESYEAKLEEQFGLTSY